MIRVSSFVAAFQEIRNEQGKVPGMEAARWSLLLRCGFVVAGRLSQQVFERSAQASFVVAVLYNHGGVQA
jgi:hypothetical protein